MMVFAAVMGGFAAPVFADAHDADEYRIAGDTRYLTAYEIAKQNDPDPETVIIVQGDGPADAPNVVDGLTASGLAGAEDAQILLVQEDRIPNGTNDALKSLDPENIIIVGGEAAVSGNVEAELEENYNVDRRVEGERRESTAAEVAMDMGEAKDNTAIIVDGFAEVDSLVAGPLALQGHPILMVNNGQNRIPQETKDAIEELGIENLIIIGGEDVVSADLETELDEMEDVSVANRLAGENRVETSIEVAEFAAFDDFDSVSLVNGWSYVDAVAASTLGEPVVYLDLRQDRDWLSDQNEDALALLQTKTGFQAIGGPVAIPESIVEAAMANIIQDLAVLDVTALTPRTLEMEFNKDVEDLERADVVVRNEAGTRVFASGVDAEDNVAEVSFFNALEDEEEYSIVVNLDDETAEYTFEYLQGDVVAIEVDGTDFTAAADQEFKVDYEVLTSTYVDVATIVDVDVEANITGVDAEDGEVTIPAQDDGKVVFFTLSYEDEDENEFESERVRVVFSETDIDEFGTFTILDAPYTDDGNEDIDWEDLIDEEELKQDITMGQTGYYLVPQLIDQYGNDTFTTTSALEFSSADPSVLIVDEESGRLTPRSEGEVDVMVEAGDVSTVYSMEVLEAAELTEIVFLDSDDEAISELDLSVLDTDGTSVPVKLLDQYGEEYSTDLDDLEVETDDEDEDVITDLVVNTTKGAIDFKVQGDAGTAVITVEQDDVEAELTVNVIQHGAQEDYELRGVTDLDLETGDDYTNKFTAELYPVDADGLRTGDAEEDVEWTVLDEDGDLVENNEQNTTTTGQALNISTTTDAAIELEAAGEYTVAAELDGGLTFTESFEVTDSRPEYEVEQLDATITTTTGTALFGELKDAVEITKGDDDKTDDIKSFTVVSTNTSVVNDEDPIDSGFNAEVEGQATLYIDKITMDDETEIAVDFVIEVTIEDQD
nr:cell wall-binding repeat-containing protein [Isachenkonia alkalipeptolytica]